MKTKFCLTAALLSVSFLADCGGTRDGNGFFPTLDLAIPNNASSTGAVIILGGHELVANPLNTIDTINRETNGDMNAFETPTSSSNILGQWGYRMSLSLDRINTVLTRLNQSDKVTATGAFSVTVSGGTVTGLVKDIDDATYSRQAVLCLNSAPYLLVKWSTDKTKVAVIRDFSKTPLSIIPATDMKSEIDYSVASDGSKTLKAYNNGVPYFTPADVTAAVGNPAYLGEAIEFGLSSTGVFTAKGVNAWNAAAYTSSSTYTGDAYLTGELGTNGSGTYVATRTFTTGCAGKFPFNDTSPTGANGFCFTGTIPASGTVTHAAFQSADWSTGLQAVGVESDSNVKFVSFDTALNCTE